MSAAIVPISRSPITIRVATMDDLPALDALQKQYGRALGYFPTKQFEGYIEMGAVLVACRGEPRVRPAPAGDGAQGEHEVRPYGYVIAQDRYLKRDELGVIYQLCVAPEAQRGLVGASLVRAVFERSAYGCKLYCCWCAQDLAANHFWESMGFVPIAFRAGSDRKRRVHIFWQRRINADDVATAYWYPCQTNAGAIREDRLVFPIPPGVHWSEVEAVAAPRDSGLGTLPEQSSRAPGRRERSGGTPKPQKREGPKRPVITATSGLRFDDATDAIDEKKAREPRRKVKNDPKLVAATRELRDRYLEHVNADGGAVLPQAKYDVSRALPGAAAGARSAFTLPRSSAPILALPAPAAA